MFYKRIWLFVLLSLLLSLVPACGEKETTTNGVTKTFETTITSMPTDSSTTTPTSSKGPVKIGAICAWSGPVAMSGISFADPAIKLVEWQVKQAGGILGGREVKIVKYDDRGSSAEVIGGCIKLVKDDKVSALVFGGASPAEGIVMSTWADQNHIMNVRLTGIQGNENAPTPKYALSASFSLEDLINGVIDFTKGLNLHKVAYLASDASDYRKHVVMAKEGLEQAGITTVYEQYFLLETIDYTPFLTKIKYAKPDALLFLTGTSEAVLSVAKQIMDIGGWDDIQVIAYNSAVTAAKLPGAQGWYLEMPWMPGGSSQASVKFEQDFKTVNGYDPTTNHVYFYNSLWVAIETIKVAGTDNPTQVADAALSGNVELDTPIGYAKYTKERGGYGGLLVSTFAHIESTKLVPIPISR